MKYCGDYLMHVRHKLLRSRSSSRDGWLYAGGSWENYKSWTNGYEGKKHQDYFNVHDPKLGVVGGQEGQERPDISLWLAFLDKTKAKTLITSITDRWLRGQINEGQVKANLINIWSDLYCEILISDLYVQKSVPQNTFFKNE